ncbi:hypothetical protein N7532_008027 [Penicillium argentinense]|uniref:Zn(2)-C6 fungal-type domain-containing protein n=1 Tax=Penicillium argentinense TaxID=1131581 RepID=A0A9W9EWK0_9EURO|nr:uncharacterized protein N7532_008027 [Penicillium argentinense]KAJ5089343.1 hypothetical protein N7532_008027 [Penicillium argentinense]
MSRPFKQREIACARCFRLKRKCDHAKPTCGECRRKSAECLPARSRRSGDSITVPVAYLKELERRVAELEDSPRTAGAHVELRDASVQTNPQAEMEDYTTGAVGDGALVLFEADLPCQSPLPSADFANLFSNLNYDNLDFFRLNKDSAYPILGDDTPWLTGLYTNIYFSIAHREWPFLNETTWKTWHKEGTLQDREEWRYFFLRMVYAIGALLCSTMHRDPAHLTRSKELYASAMNYYPHVVGHTSMVLQIQASLLLIVYALHCPSSEEISTSVSSIMPFCITAVTEMRKYMRANQEDGAIDSSGEASLENMFITCYMLNEIVASGWDRPVSAAYQAVDDDLFELGDSVQPPTQTHPAISHLFRLRKIQTNIRRSLESSRWQFSEEKDAFCSSLKLALDLWRQDIPRYGTDKVSCGYCHPNWMTKLYDYSILILMEEKRNFLDQEGTDEIFSAIVEVCLKFRQFQEEGHVMCFTWSALVFQFRAGVMLLYLIWATRPILDSPSLRQRCRTYDSPEAIEACTKNLKGFADRWEDAIPYSKVFEFLHHKILWHTGQSTGDQTLALEEAESHLQQLKNKHLHRAILGMIEDVMYGGFVQYEEVPDDYETGMAYDL